MHSEGALRSVLDAMLAASTPRETAAAAVTALRVAETACVAIADALNQPASSYTLDLASSHLGRARSHLSASSLLADAPFDEDVNLDTAAQDLFAVRDVAGAVERALVRLAGDGSLTDGQVLDCGLALQAVRSAGDLLRGLDAG